MNLIRRHIMAATLAAIAVTGTAFAQRGSAAGNLDYLAGYLSLTDVQKTQAKAIFDAAATARTTAQGQLAAAQDALKAAVKANRSDAELDRLAAAVGAVHGTIEGISAKANAKFYNLLTPEQKTKFDALGDRSTGGPRGGPGGPH